MSDIEIEYEVEPGFNADVLAQKAKDRLSFLKLQEEIARANQLKEGWTKIKEAIRLAAEEGRTSVKIPPGGFDMSHIKVLRSQGFKVKTSNNNWDISWESEAP